MHAARYIERRCRQYCSSEMRLGKPILDAPAVEMGFAVRAAGGNISFEAAARRRHEPDQLPPTYFGFGTTTSHRAAELE
jgi:hypothetical protein